jgi:hypothetical protein
MIARVALPLPTIISPSRARYRAATLGLGNALAAALPEHVRSMFDALLEILSRQWEHLLERPSGPMAFRFVLQPVMAALFAIRDGLRDARVGRSPYFWTILMDRVQRGPRLREGLAATARIIILGLVMDMIYQIVAFRAFYPLEAVIVALGLAFIPYLLLRGPAARIAHWWYQRHPPHHHAGPRSKGI